MPGPNRKVIWGDLMGAVLRVIRAHPLLSGGFFLALATLLWFAGSFVADAVYFNDPKHKNQALEEWMTPRYVSRSWKVPPEELRPLLGLGKPDGNGRPPTMGQIADELGISLEVLEGRISQISDALKDKRRSQ